jgi:hypothetical protein
MASTKTLPKTDEKNEVPVKRTDPVPDKIKAPEAKTTVPEKKTEEKKASEIKAPEVKPAPAKEESKKPVVKDLFPEVSDSKNASGSKAS